MIVSRIGMSPSGDLLVYDSDMPKKIYLDAQQLLEDSFELGVRIVESGFRPDFIVAIWRGGAPVGIAVQEMLSVAGIASDHIAIRTASYGQSIDARRPRVKVYGLDYLVDRVDAEHSLLLVDDVFDTGHTIDTIIDKLHRDARLNTPEDIRVAVPWYKPGRNQTHRIPDYYLHETEDWIKFPHSLEGLSAAEIQSHRPDIWDIVKPV